MEPMNATQTHSKVRVSLSLSSAIFVAGDEITGKMEMDCRADKGLGIGSMMVELVATQGIYIAPLLVRWLMIAQSSYQEITPLHRNSCLPRDCFRVKDYLHQMPSYLTPILDGQVFRNIIIKHAKAPQPSFLILARLLLHLILSILEMGLPESPMKSKQLSVYFGRERYRLLGIQSK